jgi:sterol desaturase/sphingolipid hydroxylase (fatty acid hydroxylase superfamily)
MYRIVIPIGVMLAAWFVLEPTYLAAYNWLLQYMPAVTAYVVMSNFITTGVYWLAVIPLSVVDWWPTEWSMGIRMQNTLELGEHSTSRNTYATGLANWERAMCMSPAWNTRRAQLFWQAICESMRNQVVGFLFGAIVALGVRPDGLTTSWWMAAVRIAIAVVINDGIFYYMHRLMHTSWFYPIHKPHHKYTSPFAAAAIACHPLEHMLCNVLPVMSAPVLAGAPLTVTWFWYTLALLNVTVFSHSGYNWPGIGNGEAHDWHHLHLNEYFGASGLFDWLHGTDRQFRASRQGLRVSAATRAEFQRITFG